MPSYEQNHENLLQLSSVFEPTSEYSLDYSFVSIDSETSNYEKWDEEIDGPIPSVVINCTPGNWYTQYWFNCALNNLSTDLDGYEFREICDYTFEDDETLYTGHFLDLY